MTRLLVLPNPFRHINPTWELIIDELSKSNSNMMIGPRYKFPCNNINRIIKQNGPFDALLIDPWFFGKSESIPDDYLPEDVYEVKIPIIVSLMQYDLHNLGHDFLKLIDQHATSIISAATGNGFFYKPTKSDFQNEDWLSRSSYNKANHYINNHRYVLFPHCISQNEFTNQRKRYDLAVPGVTYQFRRLVKDWIEEHKAQYTQSKSDDLIQKVLGRLIMYRPLGNRLNFLNKPLGLNLYRSRFIQKIAKTRVSITCDGSINYPIRKFFEIPAYGSLLAAKFFENPEKLGFQPNKNCISLTQNSLDDLIDLMEMVFRRAKETDQIKTAGQEMIRDLHTSKIRALQISDYCGALASGKINTLTWVDGLPQHSLHKEG